MKIIDEMNEKLKGKRVKVIYPEGEEPRILQAVSMEMAHGFLDPYVIGKTAKIREVAVEQGIDLEGIHIIDPDKSELIDEYAASVMELTGVPNEIVAKMLLKKPNNLSAAMLRFGDWDASLSGVASTTADVIAGNKLILGYEEGAAMTSGLMLIQSPHFHGPDGDTVVISDPSDNIDPTAEEMAEIAIVTGRNAAKMMGWQSRIAMLSFSSYGSAGHPHVDKVIEATEIVREKAPDLCVDGELQLDAAVNPEVARVKLKGKESPVAGRANVLIFPNLESSNIGVKLLIEFGGCISLGVVVQGFAKPISDMSRGATPEDIRDMTTVLASSV